MSRFHALSAGKVGHPPIEAPTTDPGHGGDVGRKPEPGWYEGDGSGVDAGDGGAVDASAPGDPAAAVVARALGLTAAGVASAAAGPLPHALRPSTRPPAWRAVLGARDGDGCCSRIRSSAPGSEWL